MKLPWFSLLALVTHCNLQDPQDNSKRSLLKLIKRDGLCSIDRYFAEGYCCVKCDKGTFKELDCPKDQPEKTVCKPCTEGKDYMDEPNGYPECRRCQHCDHVKGLELLDLCTTTHDTSCKCMENYYCNDTVKEPSNQCMNCQLCDICDHGIVEVCTPAKNTVCREPSYRNRWFLLLLVPLVALGIGLCIRFRTKETSMGNGELLQELKNDATGEPNETNGLNQQIPPPQIPDIELKESLMQIIAEVLSMDNVISCVRKINITDTRIEEIINDNLGNQREQKYGLLKCWYNAHGKQRALEDLITTLYEIGCKRQAEDILAKTKDPTQG